MSKPIDGANDLKAAQDDIDKKISDAEVTRQAGNNAFKTGDIKGALGHYYTVLFALKGLDQNLRHVFGPPPTATSILPETKISEVTDDEEETPQAPADEPPKPEDRTEKIHRTIGQTYSNMAACHIKLKNWKKALNFALDAQKLISGDTKAKFREAKARIELGELVKGRQLLVELQETADDAAIRNALKQLDIDERAREAKSKAQFKGNLSALDDDEPATVIGSSAALADVKGKGR